MPPRVTPGFLTPSAAGTLAGAAAQSEANRRELERQTRDWPEFVPAKLTGETAGSGSGSVIYCDWVEEYWDATGARIEKPGGLFGSAAWSPARTLNGESVPAFPYHCLLKRTIHTDRGVQYEVLAGGTGGSGAGAGDRVEIVEPFDSGVAPPHALLIDGRVVDIDTSPAATPGEAAWLIDANTL